MATIDLLGGKVQLYQRGTSRFWQARSSVGGMQRQFSTKKESLEQASKVAEDWFLTLHAKDRIGVLNSGPTFKKAAEQFLKEYGVITEGERSEKWTEGHAIRLRLHLVPFFGDLPLNKVTPGKVQEYRVHRMTTYQEPNPLSERKNKPSSKPPARSTLHDEVVTLRMVLKTAIRHGGGLTIFPISLPPIKHRASYRIAHGLALMNTNSFTRRRAPMRSRQTGSGSSGMPNRFMTSSCSWPTPACALTRRSILNTAT